ncbi:hypothetical protein C496_17212 [Natronorubrum tibetense GA33]|uniref:Uncharacterized protein n=1 Tax=Natronorubrum tibetense GA33 TaxID=1114856 RepID=L9VQ65_9EURY|nr:hypothetical protein C496_17212 [Natronorubrum tibetense GA33]
MVGADVVRPPLSSRSNRRDPSSRVTIDHTSSRQSAGFGSNSLSKRTELRRAAVCRAICDRSPLTLRDDLLRGSDNGAPGTGAEWIGPANGYR